MIRSCQFHSAPSTTPQNLAPTTQNTTDAYHIDTLPHDAFRIILNSIGFSDIGQVFKCCLVSSEWKRKIEYYNEIFEIACTTLNLKNVKKEQAKSAVFDKIKELKEIAEKGGEELTVLTESLPTIQDWDLNKTFKIVKKVTNGHEANLLLLNVGQSTWDSVKRYLPILIKLSQKYLLPIDLYQIVFSALLEAAKRHLFEDVLTFYEQMKWRFYDNNDFGDFNHYNHYPSNNYYVSKLHELLYNFYINNRFEQAQKLFEMTIPGLSQLNNYYSYYVSNSVYKLCKLFHKRNEVDKAKWIASELLPPIEEKALKKIRKNEDQALKVLMIVFKTYILNGEFQKVNAYLSTYPQFVQKFLDKDYVMLNESTESFLEEFALFSQVVKGNQALSNLDKKLITGIGKRSFDQFDKNPLDQESDKLTQVLEGFTASLELLRLKKMSWDNVKKYIPILMLGSNAICFNMNDRCQQALHRTLREALDRHLIDDAMKIYGETQWSCLWRLIVCDSFIEYYCMNKEVEQAEQFIVVNGEGDLVIFLFYALDSSKVGENSDKAKTIVSNVMPFVEKKVTELITSDSLEKMDLNRLLFLIGFYVHYNNENKLQELLSRKPDLVTSLSVLADDFLTHPNPLLHPQRLNHPMLLAIESLRSVLEKDKPQASRIGDSSLDDRYGLSISFSEIM